MIKTKSKSSLFTLGPKRDVGQHFEEKALAYLINKGLKLVTQNFSCKTGEIDLIMLDKHIIVFVEVRYRKNTSFMSAAETIHYFKQQKLSRTAGFFLNYQLSKYKLVNYTESRFDVVTLEGCAPELKITWIKNAF
jgi:putative endonuclease